MYVRILWCVVFYFSPRMHLTGWNPNFEYVHNMYTKKENICQSSYLCDENKITCNSVIYEIKGSDIAMLRMYWINLTYTIVWLLRHLPSLSLSGTGPKSEPRNYTKHKYPKAYLGLDFCLNLSLTYSLFYLIPDFLNSVALGVETVFRKGSCGWMSKAFLYPKYLGVIL